MGAAAVPGESGFGGLESLGLTFSTGVITLTSSFAFSSFFIPNWSAFIIFSDAFSTSALDAAFIGVTISFSSDDSFADTGFGSGVCSLASLSHFLSTGFGSADGNIVGTIRSVCFFSMPVAEAWGVRFESGFCGRSVSTGVDGVMTAVLRAWFPGFDGARASPPVLLTLTLCLDGTSKVMEMALLFGFTVSASRMMGISCRSEKCHIKVCVGWVIVFWKTT